MSHTRIEMEAMDAIISIARELRAIRKLLETRDPATSEANAAILAAMMRQARDEPESAR